MVASRAVPVARRLADDNETFPSVADETAFLGDQRDDVDVSAAGALCFQSVLDFLAGLLEVGFGLVSLAFGPQVLVAGGLAGGLL